MLFRWTNATICLAALAGACSQLTETQAAEPGVQFAGGPRGLDPTGTIHSSLSQPESPARFRLDYHGGPVMAGRSHVYLIWYGNWAGNTAPAILADLVSNLGSSSYFTAVTRYQDGSGAAPNGALIYGGSIQVGYPQGSSLTRNVVGTMVSSIIESNQFPFDPQGIYVVLPSADVAIDGFATSWCGYHDRTLAYGMLLSYALVGNSDRAPSACAGPTQPAGGPNGNRAADGMASLLAGLLASTVTDPTFLSWFDRNGLELAQKCAWTYGTTYQSPNGSLANVRLGQRDFLLQQLWWPVKKGGQCALAAP
jgi:hypothetical protein